MAYNPDKFDIGVVTPDIETLTTYHKPDGNWPLNWLYPTRAYDDDVLVATTHNNPGADTWSTYLSLFLDAPLAISGVRVYADSNAAEYTVDIDFNIDDVWTNVYSGSVSQGWNTVDVEVTVQYSRIRTRRTTANTHSIPEFEFITTTIIDPEPWDGLGTVGMMLVQRSNQPLYQVFDDEYLASQFFTGVPGYGSLPAEKEIAIRQDDWRSGFGLEMYDSAEPKRYYSSRGMDLRFRGMMVAGYGETALTKPTNYSVNLRNDTMEADSDWDDYEGTGGSRSAAYADAGTYSWNVINATISGMSSVKQVNISNYIPGMGYVIACNYYIDNTAGALAQIEVDDGVANITSSNVTDRNAWNKLTVGGQLNVGASKFDMILRSFDQTNVFFDTAVVTTNTIPLGISRAFAEHNDQLYASFGKVLGKLTTAGGAFNTVANVPANITDLEPFIDDKLYIPINSAVGYDMNASEGFTAWGEGVNTFKFMQAVHSATPTMWGSVSNHEIRSTDTPANALSWSGTTNVDSSFNKITDFITKSGALYIMKEDKPYYLDSSGAVQDDLAEELERLKRSTSGKNVHLWKKKIYIPCGEQGLLETDGTTNRFINPASYASNLSSFVGRVMAVASDEEYLFVSVEDGTQVQILAGRDETIDGSTSWVWHPIAELTLAGVETMFVSTVYQKRLYIASTDSSDSLFYIPLPTGYGDITNDSNRSFKSNVSMETPWLHGNFKDTEKASIKLTALLGHTYNTNRYFEAHYKTLENSTYTKIGDMKGTTASMVNSLFLPNAGSDNPVSTMTRLRFVANTDDTNETPIMYGYNLQSVLYPPQREIIACIVRCANDIVLKDGTLDIGSEKVIATVLDEARKATWPVTIYDINGDAQTVKFLPLPAGTPRWTVIRDEKARTVERHYNLLLQLVALE